MSGTPNLPRLSELPITCTSCKICPAKGCELRAQPYNADLATFSRRTLVAAGTGTFALVAMGGSVIAQENGTPAATAATCVTLTPELTEGPYYIDDLLLRDDITEGRPGVPLTLAITVIDAGSCEPLPDVAVDIWHCDALGDYSGISGQSGNDDTGGQTWLRGVQLTDQSGVATITTVYPGWYIGRCTHIHLKAHTGGTADDGTYLGGTTAHTGQLFFDDAVTDAVAQLEPYVQRIDIERMRNEDDGVLGAGIDNPAFYVELTPIDETDLSLGFTGTATLGIDPTAVSTETGSGNGGPGQGDGPPDRPGN